MTGHAYRRFRFKKRTHTNQNLGPFLTHEMNRCIQCYRCVRYYRDYAGGRDLNVFAIHDSVYFGRYEDGVLENEFAGNLVEVCPVGVFTDRTFSSHYARKWDLQTAPSICVHCSVGCNTIPGERYDILRRIRTRYNEEVNWNFLCDRGRFGYEFVNSDRRIRQPLARTESQGVRTEEAPPGLSRQSSALRPIEPEQALEQLGKILSRSKRVIGIGSPRASLEANFALRTLVGPDSFYLGMSDGEARLVSTMLRILRDGPAPSASLKQVRESDAVLVLGEDVTNAAPMLALALRQSVRQQPLKKVAAMGIPQWNDAAAREVTGQETGPLFLATAAETRLADVATRSFHAAPADLARLGFAVAEEVSGQAGKGKGAAGLDLPDEVRDLADAVARALLDAERPLVVSGTSLGSEEIVQAAADVAWALRRAGRPASLSYVVSECNTLGLGLLGGKSIQEAFRAVQEGRADTVVVLENDLYRRADAARVDAFLAAAPNVVVLDHLANRTTVKADVVLPAATFAESDGTLVNQEGRAQRFYQVFVPKGTVQESWRWLRDVAVATGWDRPMLWDSLDDVVGALAKAVPVFEPVAEIAPPSTFRIHGTKIARQHYRYSGRTAMTANIDVSEPKPPDDPDSPLAFSMEGYQGQPPSPLIPRFWAPGWNSEQALIKFQEEVSGPLRGGSPGKRLIEPVLDAEPDLFERAPEAFEPRPGEWLVVPLYHIFGSEELSVSSKGIAELAPQPYLALSPGEAERHGLREGEELDVELGGRMRRLALKLIPTLPPGVAGVPAGLPGLEGVTLPTKIEWGRW